MATTTNFGWETPDDTDLVKDGALAIRTLGNSIDTSLVDLKGGTTGQVLSKTSNTDMDFTWVTSDDANAIQNTIVDAKGDLISATGSDVPARLAVGNNGETLVADSSTSTGLKWKADTVNTVVDAKGDLLVGTAADTLSRLAVGTDGYTLQADSSTATGLKWAAASSGGMTLINTGGTTLTGSSIIISSIPATYNNLQLVIRDFLPANDGEPVRIRLNGDTGTSYRAYLGFAAATGAAATTFLGISDGNDNASTNSLMVFDLLDYTNTVTYKLANFYTVTTSDTAPSTEVKTRFGAGVYFSTSAINSITIFPDGGNFTSGTAFLYGVK